MAVTKKAPRIYVLAGVNGAGKSSVGGALIRAAGLTYYNPDDHARDILAEHPHLSLEDVNSAVWTKGKELLERAIEDNLDFAFETTLGGHTITRLLKRAAQKGHEVHIWYAGLESPELHIQRVEQRVRDGGHPVLHDLIRTRYDRSRENLIELLPVAASVRIFDNSAHADWALGKAPKPILVLDMDKRKIRKPKDLSKTPNWAKPIVASAINMQNKK